MKFNFVLKKHIGNNKGVSKIQFFDLMASGVGDLFLYSVHVEEMSLSPLFKTDYGIYFQEPDHKFSSIYFLKVFHPVFWLCIFGIIMILAGFLINYARLHRVSISNIILAFFHIISFSCETNQRSTLSLKMCASVVSIFIFCISAAFSGFLSAELTISKFILPFETLDEMPLQKDYFLCSEWMALPKFLLENEQKFQNIFNTERCGQEIIISFDQVASMLCNDRFLTFITQNIRFQYFKHFNSGYDGIKL